MFAEDLGKVKLSVSWTLANVGGTNLKNSDTAVGMYTYIKTDDATSYSTSGGETSCTPDMYGTAVGGSRTYSNSSGTYNVGGFYIYVQSDKGTTFKLTITSIKVDDVEILVV